MTIREKLVACGMFEQNEYFNQYISLIDQNLTTEKSKLTQCHHIIPRYYYNKNKIIDIK